jgi:hypothetical protein
MSASHPESARMVEGSRPPLSAYEVVAHIVDSNRSIESLSLVTYEEGPNWRDLRRTDEGADVGLLLKGLQQDRGKRTLTKVSRAEASAENLRDVAQSLPNNKLLGVLSRVRLVGGESAHIPMMDFMCTPSARNLETLVHLLTDLRQGRGCLLESGRSYHYYAFQLFMEEQWRVFLGKCLLMSGYTDDRYIGHQLVDGHCVLRLSSRKSKASAPTVVAQLS